jgi:hypothetical protein
LPSDPVVGYLARTLSLFYALLGGLLWFVSLDLQRYRPVLRYLAWGIMIFGVFVWRIDFVENLPAFWKHAEGPIVLCYGALLLVLTGRIRQDARADNTPGASVPKL